VKVLLSPLARKTRKGAIREDPRHHHHHHGKDHDDTNRTHTIKTTPRQDKREKKKTFSYSQTSPLSGADGWTRSLGRRTRREGKAKARQGKTTAYKTMSRAHAHHTRYRAGYKRQEDQTNQTKNKGKDKNTTTKTRQHITTQHNATSAKPSQDNIRQPKNTKQQKAKQV
jgi:hypothetical protein